MKLMLLAVFLVTAAMVHAQTIQSIPAVNSTEPTGIDDDEFGITAVNTETTGIEEDDLGVTSGSTDTTGIEHEDIGATGSDETEGDPDRPVITGTVPNPETTGIDKDAIGIADPEEAKGSGDVVIKGSDIKENSLPDDKHKDWIELLSTTDTKTDDAHEKWIEIESHGAVDTEDDLKTYAESLTLYDENIEEVSFNYVQVKMDYKQPAKLFGFINVDYTAEAVVDDFGRVKVQFPFWLFLTQNNANEIKADLEETFQGDDAQLSNIDLQNQLQKQQQHMTLLSSIMKTKHDTAKAAIQNVR